MAVVIRYLLSPASREQLLALDTLVGDSLLGAGGPPAGLMSHVGYPVGDGVEIADVWASEEQGRAWVQEVLRPLLARAGLTAGEVDVVPVWSFARP
ncbi:hypothetical protein E8D34_19660 [Nocardioides sp. GY 10113]|uniref:hypothetical protein n=1 Tax=Nocardioides sp. GY 10113 TaxID=2569761 RepID=UPI0010A8CAF5|nr:hypothetical protein [Nocardioides sp. GY 10113]TIC79888.1 hypothetical protein E8D34_19660 [Nocardioides sp. GY 10113]